MTSVLVVIPTYNESESIESLLKRLNSARMQISNKYEVEILIVDDNSPDQTAVIAKNLQLAALRVLSRQHKSGLGPAYLAGFKQGLLEKYEYFVEMDADLSHQPEAIISIFDRYGKLLKQMSAASDGWDGRYNGENLPSTDYWFLVEYFPQNTTQKQQFRAHFSLIR